MPFWKSFVFTKGEVEDGDLPLPEHRIFDDNGNVKPSFRVASSLHRGALSAKKASSAAVKKTGAVMNLVRSRLSGSREPVDAVEDVPAPARTSTASARKSVSPRKSATPRKSQATSPAVVIPTTTSPRASTGRAKSPAPPRPSAEVPAASTSSPKRTASVSPKPRSGTTSPQKVKKAHKDGSAVVKRKRVKKSSSQKKSRSQKKSSSSPKKKSASPKKRVASPRKKTPSLSPSKRAPSQDWTVPELKEYAKENAISLTGVRAKTDILNVIEKTI